MARDKSPVLRAPHASLSVHTISTSYKSSLLSPPIHWLPLNFQHTVGHQFSFCRWVNNENEWILPVPGNSILPNTVSLHLVVLQMRHLDPLNPPTIMLDSYRFSRPALWCFYIFIHLKTPSLIHVCQVYTQVHMHLHSYVCMGEKV